MKYRKLGNSDLEVSEISLGSWLTYGVGVEAGNLSINNLVASIAETPFGGVKDSGYGREGGTEGLQCYTVVKNVSHLMT